MKLYSHFLHYPVYAASFPTRMVSTWMMIQYERYGGTLSQWYL